MNKRVFRIMIALLLAAFVPKAYGQTDAWDGTTQTEVKPSGGNTYTINTGAELAWVAEQANKATSPNNFSDKTIQLAKGIDLNGKPWTPIGTFKGTFDGCGFVISNLSASTTTSNAGLFQTIDAGGIVKNLGITSGSLTSTGSGAGGIAGQNSGTILNCYTSVTVTSKSNSGGIAGYNYGTILNCYTTGAVTCENGNAGGIAGYNGAMGGGSTIQYCYATGAISGNQAGGIAGKSGDDPMGNGNIQNCIALNNSITGTTSVGRIAGSKGNGTLAANYAAPSISGTWEATDKDGAKKDGADLTTDNFISSNNAFAGEWATDSNWKFADKDFTNLPKLMTTGLTSNKEVGVQTAIKRTDYIGHVLIEGPVAYSTNLHKGKDIIISPTGILTVDAEAQVNSLEIQQGGQVKNTQALSVTKTITTTRTLANKWITFGTPIEMAAAPTTSTYALTGYAKANATNQKWATAEVIQANTAHLLAADAAETVLTFIASGTDGSALRIPVAESAPTGEALNTGIFLFLMNPSLCNQTMKNIYTLSADGAYFELQKTDYTLKPFECYLTANTATQTAVLSLRAGGDLPTGNELPALPSDAFRIWGDNGQLHMDASQPHDVKIYNLSGSLLHSFRLDGQHALTLGRGIYLVHSNNITYKVSL